MNRLEQIAALIERQKNPPVHLWQPESQGKIDIRIDTQGRWFHEGGEIKRLALVKLFASILWFEKGRYYLVTPLEKLQIEVADVPFIVQRMELADDVWVASINTGQSLIVGEHHPVQLRDYRGQELPYVRVRYDLWARLTRSIYFEWASIALENSAQQQPVLYSGDYRFSLASE